MYSARVQEEHTINTQSLKLRVYSFLFEFECPSTSRVAYICRYPAKIVKAISNDHFIPSANNKLTNNQVVTHPCIVAQMIM